ncbi:MAG: hypothetical protein ACYTF6_14005, partial [Planctomycetota bacterium]
RDVRTAAAVNRYAGPTVVCIIPPATGGGAQQIEYEYDENAGTLLYRVTVDGNPTTHMLLGGNDGTTVTAFDVTYVAGQDWQGLDCTKSVTVHLEFKIDGQTYAATTSAAPRRNQLY